MIRGGHTDEDPQLVVLFGFKQPVYPGSAVFRKIEEKFSLVAAVGNMPRVSGEKISIGSGHSGCTSPLPRSVSEK